jgi:hypothetical protein
VLGPGFLSPANHKKKKKKKKKDKERGMPMVEYFVLR